MIAVPPSAPALRAEDLDPISDPRWASFVADAPRAQVFHTPAWLALLQRSYGYKVTAHVLLDADGAIAAGVPLVRVGGRLRGRRLSALPFSDHCSPLLAAGADPSLDAELVSSLRELGRRENARIELRGPLGEVPGGHLTETNHLHEVRLEADADAVINRFGRKSQLLRGARRAEREGLVLARRTDRAALEVFYGLHLETRRRQGVPTQPKSFILGFETLFAQGLGFVELVLDGDKPIAAAVFLHHNGVLTYKYGASDASALSKRPNNLLFLEVIKWACGEGFHTLDMGRTSAGHESLREFKLSWGAEERALDHVELSDAAPGPVHEGPGLADRFAPVIRKSPPVVSRVVGAALYRFAG